LTGWGEAALLRDPIYLEEWINSGWIFICEYLLPEVIGKEISSYEYYQKIKNLRRNNIAKYAVETALWSLEAQENKIPYWKLVGGVNKKIEIGASVGINSSIKKTLDIVEAEIARGLKRIKLKIKPGWDYEIVRAVRKKYSDILLMVDANSSYKLSDLPKLKALDEFNLLMIEQPLAHDDIIDHAKLAAELITPICLDESICSSEDARKAIEIKACKIINVKPARVGSLYEVQKINEMAKMNGVKLWCGGMLESDLGKVSNLAAASLSEFSLPADISDWSTHFSSTFTNVDKYYDEGNYFLDDKFGLNIEIDEKWLDSHTVREAIVK